MTMDSPLEQMTFSATFSIEIGGVIDIEPLNGSTQIASGVATTMAPGPDHIKYCHESINMIFELFL